MKYALRTLLKSPGFSLVAVLTLALGIGANTTFFSVLYGVVLRGLPFPDDHELVEVRNHGSADRNYGQISVAELRDYRARQHSFDGIGAYSVGRVTLSLADGAERVVQTSITSNLFSLLGVQPVRGRTFREEEEQAGKDSVVIISHDFWQRHFDGSSEVLGRTVRLNAVEHTVVGVMPADFSFSPGVPGTEIWKPLDLAPRGTAYRKGHSLSTIARLKDGSSLAGANSGLERMARQLQTDQAGDYPAGDAWTLRATTMRQSQFGAMLAPLGMLMSAAAAVLLIACVNVSIMLLLRAAARRREIMIRLAVGASRWHIVRQLLAESLIICVFGAAGGLGLAVCGVELLKTFPPADIPRLQEVSIDALAAAFTVGVLVIVTLVVGLIPAASLYRTRAPVDIAQANRTTDSRAAVRLRETLTGIEIALAVLLLVGGGLALRSLHKLVNDDLGFSTQQLFTFKTNLTQSAYPDLARANDFYQRLTARLEALPGVASVSAVSYLPLSGESQVNAALPLASEKSSTVAWRVVRGPYFSAIGATLLQGRLLDESDRADAPLVAVVDDKFARKHWVTESAALGQAVRFGDGPAAQTRTIVGIVRHLKHFGPGQVALPEVFVPQAQVYQRGMYTVIKASASANLASQVRTELAQVDPTVPMYFVETMEGRFSAKIAMPRFTAGLVSTFAGLALALAGVGIFGVTAYSVAQRTREFGIRIALGASRGHVAGQVFGRIARIALIGGTVGALAALHLEDLMRSLLVDVDAVDVPTLLAAAAIIGITALLASLVPMLRALRVSPVDALRAE